MRVTKRSWRRRSVVLALLVLLPPRVFAALGDCGQPKTDGEDPLSSDCQFILRAAVGAAACETPCICDVGADGKTTAGDALVCLRKAVGQPEVLTCICGGCILIANGDFETQVVADGSGDSGWSYANNPAGGWQGTSFGNPGHYFLLNGLGELAVDPTLAQTVGGLTAGMPYRLSGYYQSYAPNFGNPAKPDAFAVKIEPQPSDYDSSIVLAIPRPSPDPIAWTAFHVDFVASAETETISIIAERDGDDSSFGVDTVCLQEILR